MTIATKDQGDRQQWFGDDVVLPFTVEKLEVRGRTVQLGPMLDAMFARHKYPPAVSALLGEMTVLTVLLGTSLKFNGKFIVQTQTDGPVSLMVVDLTTPDAVRAYARYDEVAVNLAVRERRSSPQQLLGEGAMGMTIDQGEYTQRYQGIVALEGASLEEVARQYFRQSEQIPTEIRLAAAEILTPSEDGNGVVHRWRAGGVLTQFLPAASKRIPMADLPGGDRDDQEIEYEIKEDECWLEAKALMTTIGDDELTDPQIQPERLLYRLFHESGVRVFEGIAVRDKCSCSQEKITDMVRGFSEENREGSFENGVITTTCEFCSSTYVITRKQLDEF